MRQISKKQGYITTLFKNFKLAMGSASFSLKSVCFIGASIVSALINLVFISNLTKSAYTVGTLFSVPAAIVLGFLSIILDLVKVLHVTQVNTLEEIYTSLGPERTWRKTFKKLKNSWFAAYLLYVALSVLTSVSLSTISIGSGITRNANTIKQIDEYILDGQKYVNINKATSNIAMESYVKGADVDLKNAEATAQASNDARKAWEKIAPDLLEFQELRIAYIEKYGIEALSNSYEHTPESKVDSDTLDNKRRQLKTVLAANGYAPGASASGETLSKLSEETIIAYIKQNKVANGTIEVSSANIDKLGKLKNTSVLEAYQWLKDINKATFINPKTGNALVVEIDESKDVNLIPIQVSSAIKELKALRVDVENDSGDIGSSSKIFMQIGSAIEGRKNKQAELSEVLEVKTSGSFGMTELMMMAVLLFLSLLCELAINQCSPRTPITRDALRGFMQHFPADFNVSDYMIDVLLRKLEFGEITKEEFDKQIKECVERRTLTREKILENAEEQERKKIEDKKIEAVQKFLKKEEKKPKKETTKLITVPEPIKEPAIEKVENAPKVEEPKTTDEQKPNKEQVKEPIKKPVVENVPKVDEPKTIDEQKESNKIFVKPAENELSEMLGMK